MKLKARAVVFAQKSRLPPSQDSISVSICQLYKLYNILVTPCLQHNSKAARCAPAASAVREIGESNRVRLPNTARYSQLELMHVLLVKSAVNFGMQHSKHLQHCRIDISKHLWIYFLSASAHVAAVQGLETGICQSQTAAA